MADLEIGGSWGVAFLVSAAIVADIIAKACSSPQTTELNAGTRARTLMKWVTIGVIEAAFLVGIAAIADKKYRIPIILGGVIEVVVTYAEYVHGKNAGLRSAQPGTESY